MLTTVQFAVGIATALQGVSALTIEPQKVSMDSEAIKGRVDGQNWNTTLCHSQGTITLPPNSGDVVNPCDVEQIISRGCEVLAKFPNDNDANKKAYHACMTKGDFKGNAAGCIQCKFTHKLHTEEQDKMYTKRFQEAYAEFEGSVPDTTFWEVFNKDFDWTTFTKHAPTEKLLENPLPVSAYISDMELLGKQNLGDFSEFKKDLDVEESVNGPPTSQSVEPELRKAKRSPASAGDAPAVAGQKNESIELTSVGREISCILDWKKLEATSVTVVAAFIVGDFKIMSNAEAEVLPAAKAAEIPEVPVVEEEIPVESLMQNEPEKPATENEIQSFEQAKKIPVKKATSEEAQNISPEIKSRASRDLREVLGATASKKTSEGGKKDNGVQGVDDESTASEEENVDVAGGKKNVDVAGGEKDADVSQDSDESSEDIDDEC